MKLINTETIDMTDSIYDCIMTSDNFCKFILKSIEAYKKGDLNNTCKRNNKSSNYALKNGESNLAVYIYRKGTPEETTIWIITDRDESKIKVLFPSEY